jgi:hypothetical protein
MGIPSALCVAALAYAAVTRASAAIDRKAVVTRHTVRLQASGGGNISGYDVLAVGNGQLVFNVGIDGLQTFNDTYSRGYDVNTMAEWGWHVQPWSASDPSYALRSYNFSYIDTATDGEGSTRPVPYYVGTDGFGNSSGDVVGWVMANPHKMNLGQTSLRWTSQTPGGTVVSLPVEAPHLGSAAAIQDAWAGTVTSTFTLDAGGVPPTATCGLVEENAELILSCGDPTLVITGIAFAAYGNVSGSCPSGLAAVNCSDSDSLAVVSAACVGKPFCSVQANNAEFGGDPCPQFFKHLGSSGVTCGPAPAPPPTSPVTLTVTTTVHPDVDLVATRVAWQMASASASASASAPGAAAPIGLRLAFPYAAGAWGPSVSDWGSDGLHSTAVVASGPQWVTLRRTLDSDGYRVDCAWSDPSWAFSRSPGFENVFDLLPPPSSGAGGGGTGGRWGSTNTNTSGSVDFLCLYSPPDLAYPAGAWMDWLRTKAAATGALFGPSMPTTLDAVVNASAAAWQDYWLGGAFLDLASNTNDTRAFELERRTILSQYLLRIHNAGAEPPAETGLLCNSWSGKHHLEMRFWHHAHWPLWNRADLLSRSDGFYVDLLPNVTAYAAFQGYGGARWLKESASVLNRSGVDVPWLGLDYAPFPFNNGSTDGVGTLLSWEAAELANAVLVWQQPHVVWLADAQRRVVNATSGQDAALAVMRNLSALVFATADYLSTRPYMNASDGAYWLGPPLMGAEEMGGGPSTPLHNPTFETVYFAAMLDVANEWRAFLGMPANATWDDVASRMARPVVDVGSDPSAPTYSFNLDCACVFNDTAHCPPGRAGKTVCGLLQSHPAMIGVWGMVNGRARGDRYGVDVDTLNRTVAGVVSLWDWGSPTDGTNTWGWDYGFTALSMARAGWGSDAIADFLLLDTQKNTYLPNGHNYQDGSLPAYLPGNGGLLLALAMLAGGSDTSPPLNFPPGWAAQAEGFAIAYP